MNSRRPQPNPSQRGLGHAHRVQREALFTVHRDGAPCPCTDCGPACPCRAAGLPLGLGLPMYRDATMNVDGMPLEADHGDLSRNHGGHRANRLLIATCNRSRGDGTRKRATRDNGPRPRWSRPW